MYVNILDRALGECVHAPKTIVQQHEERIRALKGEVEALSSRLDNCSTKIKCYEKEIGTLLGIEGSAKQVLEADVLLFKTLKKDVLEKKQEKQNHVSVLQREIDTIKNLKERYQGILLEPLTWRREGEIKAIKYPAIVVFALDDQFVTLRAERYGTEYQPSSVPYVLKSKYGDVLDALATKVRSSRKEEVQLSCEFSGTIPADVKEKIIQAKVDFKEHVYILAEPAEWSLKETKAIDPDPLVVGYHEDTPNVLWLIAKFDTTPIEDLVASLTIESTPLLPR